MADEIVSACDSQFEKDKVEANNTAAVLFFIIDIKNDKAIYIPCSHNNQYGTKLVLEGKFQMANKDDNNQLFDPPRPTPIERVDRNGTQVIELPTVVSRKLQLMPALLGSVEAIPHPEDMVTEVKCMEYMGGTVKCHGDVFVEADTNVIKTKESNSDDIESKEVNSNSHDALASDVDSNDVSSSKSDSHDTAESSCKLENFLSICVSTSILNPHFDFFFPVSFVFVLY